MKAQHNGLALIYYQMETIMWVHWTTDAFQQYL